MLRRSGNSMINSCIRSSGWMRIETFLQWESTFTASLHPVFGLDED